MKHLSIVAVMLLTLMTFKATAQLNKDCGPIQHTLRAQSFDGCLFAPNMGTMNGLGFTPVVFDDTTGLFAQNPIIYFQSDVVTATETDSARNYTALGKYYVIDKWARLDTIVLHHAYYFTGQLINLLAVKSTNDSTVIIPDAGTINGASTYWWTDSTTSYKQASIIYDGTNYFIKK